MNGDAALRVYTSFFVWSIYQWWFNIIGVIFLIITRNNTEDKYRVFSYSLPSSFYVFCVLQDASLRLQGSWSNGLQLCSSGRAQDASSGGRGFEYHQDGILLRPSHFSKLHNFWCGTQETVILHDESKLKELI